MFNIDNDVPIGIDLGTTNSCIAYWDENEVKIIPNRVGEKITPSIIYLHNNEFIIGEYIQKDLKLSRESEKIYSIKRIIGQDYNDRGLLEEIKNLHYNILKNEVTNKPVIRLYKNGKYEDYTPEELSSLILKKLKEDAEKLLLRKIDKVVISVPAYFDDAQRNATIEAARLADLTVIRIINEPTAAALSYGLGQNFCPIKKKISCFSNVFKKNRKIRESLNMQINNNKINSNSNDINNRNSLKSSFCLIQDDEKNDLVSSINKINEINIKSSINKMDEKGKNIMVFDLGGGTFDLAILNLNIDKKEYEVKSKYSDKHLGGDDFDNKLVDYCLKYCNFEKQMNEIDNKSKERLKKACEHAKKVLSKQEDDEYDDDEDENNIKTQIRVDNLLEGKDILVTITRKQFEEDICKDLFDRLEKNFTKLLEEVEKEREKFKIDKIDEIILVGGSTRMPKIKKIIRKHLKECKINDEINPDEVVAYGAAIQAAMLLTLGKNNYLNDVKLLDITPISLGTDVVNKSNEPKIKELGNKMSIIIPKWTSIPTEKTKVYQTIEDNQPVMKISIFEGENDYLKYNKLLDTFNLIELPQKPKGEVKCEITFKIDENNILSVTAKETSTGLSKNIQVISNREIERKKSSNKNLNIYDINERKQTEKKVKELFKLYKDAKNNQSKIIVLENYNKSIKENLSQINPNGAPENINENNIEKYFIYVYQLLESYEEILYLNKDDKKEKELINEIKKYINIFKNQSCYYIKEIIDLFKGAKKEIFLDIFSYSTKILNEVGLDYLNNLRQFSRYYAKLYFEVVLKLYKKYITKEDELTNEDIAKEKNISDQNLQKINSNAISLIMKSKKEKALIEPLNSNDEKKKRQKMFSEKWNETGFTFFNKKINPENEELSNDEYNLIYDELTRIHDETVLNIKKANDDNLKKELIEEEGICLGNMAKIKYIYQKGTEYHKYKKMIDNCLKCAELCHKNEDNNCNWFFEAVALQRELDNIIINNNNNDNDEEEIKREIEPIISELDKFYNANKERFIDYILTNFPYNGYNEKSRDSRYDWNKCNRDLIDFLRKKYDPNNYPKRTKEEKKRYYIILNISQKLNSILN